MRLIVCEFHPEGNRPLGVRDEFLTGSFSEDQVAHFFSESAAQAAMERATNKRTNGNVQIVGPIRAAA